jgi:hypothetical protein
MSAAVQSLPWTRAQLLELRRAGVTQWRCTIDGVTHELHLRPLPIGRQAAQRSVPQRSTSSKAGGEGAAAAHSSARLSRGQRRRRNVAANKALMAVRLQRFARGLLARASARRARLKNELLALKNEIKARKKAAIAAKKTKLEPTTSTIVRVASSVPWQRSPKTKRMHARGPPTRSAVPAVTEPNDPPPRDALKRRSIMRPSAWRAQESGEQAVFAGS